MLTQGLKGKIGYVTGALMFASAATVAGGANAIPLLETYDNVTTANGFAADLSTAVGNEYSAAQISANGLTDGLIYGKNVSGGNSDPNVYQVARINSEVLGAQVDALAKIELDDGVFEKFESFDIRVTNSAALSITCTSEKCASFNWTFDQSETDLANDWNIVKFGVKYGGGEGPAYFLVEEFGVGADSGSFNLGDYITFDANFKTTDTDNPLYQFFNPNSGKLNGLSHFDVFGTAQGGDVPEPGTLAVLGLALAGLGIARRRKRS